MPLHELSPAVLGDKAHSVNTEAIHMTERTRKAVSRHNQHEHVECARLLAEEVVCGVVCCSCLWDGLVGLWLKGVNHVGEKNAVVDEENW